MKRFLCWMLATSLFLLAFAAGGRMTTEADTTPRMLGLCMNPSGALIPIGTLALGQSVSGGYQQVAILAQNSGSSYYLQCDASGNLLLSGSSSQSVGNLSLPSGGSINWNSDAYLSRAGNSSVEVGNAAGSSTNGILYAGGQVSIGSAGSTTTTMSGSGTEVAASNYYSWSSTALSNGTRDTTLCRSAAGVVEANNSTGCGSGGTLLAAVVQKSVIYSAAGTALPTCNTAAKGIEAVVSDATGPTFLATYTSGGAVFSPVVCNGSNWVTY